MNTSTPHSHTVSAPPEQFNFADFLLQRNAHWPERTAFIDDTGSLSYGELDHRVRSMAAALLALGLRREERVLLLMHDSCDWPVCFLGALYAGLVPVAVNTLLTADDYAYMLGHARAQAVLVSDALRPVLAAAMAQSPHEVAHVLVSKPREAPLGAASATGTQDTPVLAKQPLAHVAEHALHALLQAHEPLAQASPTRADDVGFWLYSSGSTGRPKGAVHTHANPYWTSLLYGQNVLGLTANDVCFSAAKLFFAYGLGNGLTFPLTAGACTVLMAERPTPDATFKRLTGRTNNGATRPKPTVFFGAPTGFAGMLASAHLPARQDVALRLVSSAGEALPAEIGERFEQHFGVPVVDGIGSTEMLHIYLSNLPHAVRYGTTGWPVPGYAVQLRGDDGLPVPDGEPGDLYTQGPSAALLYWSNRDKTREAFQGHWTKSGDKYVRNTDGTYTYSGRSDDMLKVSGIYVSPFEVEATLIRHPEVLEAAVIGVSDGDGLTKTKAFVVRQAGSSVSEDALKAFVKDKLAPYKYPRLIEFVSELPKTATGKIQRFKLRAQEPQ